MRRTILVVMGVWLLATLSVAAGSAASPVAHGGHPPSSGRLRNPHLHGPAREAHDERHDHDPPFNHDRHHDHWHSHWYGRWDYWAYISLHRGYGSVTGTVRGAPEGTILVNLRKPGGKIFRSASKKHSVRASAAGNFLMTGVRAGSYRIIAHTPNGKHIAHAQVGVHTGHTSSVAIRW